MEFVNVLLQYFVDSPESGETLADARGAGGNQECFGQTGQKFEFSANNCRGGNTWWPWLSVCKLPLGRFRTWPWNREFFRRGCLAVVCRCFAVSGVERKDVDRQKSKLIQKGCQNYPFWIKGVPTTTTMEPKRCPNEPKGYQNTMTNQCLKKVAERIETVKKHVLSHSICWCWGRG